MFQVISRLWHIEIHPNFHSMSPLYPSNCLKSLRWCQETTLFNYLSILTPLGVQISGPKVLIPQPILYFFMLIKKAIKALYLAKKNYYISLTVFAETCVKVDAVVSVKWQQIYLYRLALYIVRLYTGVQEVQNH